jgi:CheY-like chemotaxis protein
MSENVDQPGGPSSRGEPCTPRRILIVDDEKAIRDVFQLVLTMGLPGCKADLAVNGAEAVSMFNDLHHELLLMDLHMPVMDGETAFYEIQKICDMNQWQMPSVVFCTGYEPSNMLKELIANQPAHCVLRKPVSNKILVDALKARLTAL